MADFEFTDNSIKVKAEIEAAVIAWLYEAGGELEAKTKRNTNPPHYGEYDVKNSWNYIVNEAELEATIGSAMEAAFWAEFGTGEHALNNDGRKGWWVYVEGNNNRAENQKYYTEEEAKATAAFMRANGLPAHATNGMEPVRPLFNAFNSRKNALIRRFEEIMNERTKK